MADHRVSALGSEHLAPADMRFNKVWQSSQKNARAQQRRAETLCALAQTLRASGTSGPGSFNELQQHGGKY